MSQPIRPWTRCAVCGYRKWTHWILRMTGCAEARDFYTTTVLDPPSPKRWWA